MPGITNPAEEYFKDGLWGWVTNAWKKLVATAGGALHIQFAGQEADVEITQTAAADLTPGICGWDGDSWQKLPMLWGYSSDYGEYEFTNDVAAGDRELTFSSAAADEVWVIDILAGWADQANPSSVEFTIYTGGAEQMICAVAYPVAALTVSPPLPLHVPPLGYLKVKFKGCSAGDDIRATATGYKMKIAE